MHFNLLYVLQIRLFYLICLCTAVQKDVGQSENDKKNFGVRIYDRVRPHNKCIDKIRQSPALLPSSHYM